MQVQDLIHNQLVGLSADAAFRGYFYGISGKPDKALGEIALVYVKEPGASGRKQGAVTLLPVSELASLSTRVRP